MATKKPKGPVKVTIDKQSGPQFRSGFAERTHRIAGTHPGWTIQTHQEEAKEAGDGPAGCAHGCSFCRSYP